MATNFQIPDKSTLIPTTTIFSAQFNVPTVGRYDFTLTPANQNVFCMDMRPDVIYFIDSYSVGANITEEQFLESITVFPQLQITKRFDSQNLYRAPLQIVNFTDHGELSNFFHSDILDDQLLLSFTGELRQLASMVGISPVRIQVSMNIFEIEEQYFSAAHRDAVNVSMGQRNRR
jgi:hypothetical protein